jgi:tetratricopeptide (TPR) repeat protein
MLALIEVHRDSGDKAKSTLAIGTLLRMARDTERKDLEAQAWMESALTEEASEDLGAALQKLREAENLLREMGNSEGLGAVYLRSGTIRLQLGLRNEALVDLREAARHAELSGNAASYATALNELGEALGSLSPEGRECLERARQLKKAGRIKAPDQY